MIFKSLQSVTNRFYCSVSSDLCRTRVCLKVAVHQGDFWPCDWLIVPGTKPGTWRIKTCGHGEAKQPSGWGLSAWQAPGDTLRDKESSWVCVHEGDKWPCDWIFEKAEPPAAIGTLCSDSCDYY